jgi:hypothetical protein
MTEEANTQETEGNGGITPEKVAQVKALFAKHEEIGEEEKQLDDMMAAVRVKKSNVVKEIEAILGKGPFEWKGEELVITKRGDTHYFRTRGKSAVTVIG